VKAHEYGDPWLRNVHKTLLVCLVHGPGKSQANGCIGPIFFGGFGLPPAREPSSHLGTWQSDADSFRGIQGRPVFSCPLEMLAGPYSSCWNLRSSVAFSDVHASPYSSCSAYRGGEDRRGRASDHPGLGAALFALEFLVRVIRNAERWADGRGINLHPPCHREPYLARVASSPSGSCVFCQPVPFKTGSATVASRNGNGRSSRDHNRLARGEGYDRYALQIFQPGKLVDRTVPLGRPAAGPGGRSLFSDQLVAILWGASAVT
jgi:hypothetical protein